MQKIQYSGEINHLFEFGLNLFSLGGLLEKHNFEFKYEIPVTNNINGFKMFVKNNITFGWQFTF